MATTKWSQVAPAGAFLVIDDVESVIGAPNEKVAELLLRMNPTTINDRCVSINGADQSLSTAALAMTDPSIVFTTQPDLRTLSGTNSFSVRYQAYLYDAG